jgi:hypothetical protein
MRSVALALLLVMLLACRPEPPRTETGAPIDGLLLHEVDWNPTHALLEGVQEVADDGPVVAVVTRRGATVLTAGAVAFQDQKAWTSATVVPGADGAPHWIVLVGGDGHVAYLKNKSTLEDVSPRYGLDGVAVRRATPSGGATVAFQLDREMAVADGTRVARYASPLYLMLAGGGGAIAGTLEDRIDVLRPSEKTATSYALPHVLAIAVGSDGTLYAARRALRHGRGADALPHLSRSARKDPRPRRFWPASVVRRRRCARRHRWGEGHARGSVAHERRCEALVLAVRRCLGPRSRGAPPLPARPASVA